MLRRSKACALREVREAREEASRACRAESKPCRSASHNWLLQPHCHGDHRDETALARVAARGPPRALDSHPTGRFVEERKKPGIEAKRIVALGPSESLGYRKLPPGRVSTRGAGPSRGSL